MIEKVKVKNIIVYAFPNKKVFLDYIEKEHKILVAINAEKILNDNTELHRIINENVAYADGYGAVMALKKKGLEAVKIPGAEFWLDIVKEFHKAKSFYLLGASQEVIEKTVIKLKSQYPTINIVGYRNGFLNDNDKEDIIIELREKKPDIVFVAQGSPRQEYLMDELMKVHPALYMGLGGSFDVYCGLKRRAPQFFLDSNLEWFYRLLKEPTRFSRQLVLIKFMILLKTIRL